MKAKSAALTAADFPESRVVKIWQECLPGRHDLLTEEDGPIRVVYPGRINDDRGADLCDAVIATSRGLRQGDIEVHVRSSGWWGHHHHLDPLYNKVILHVVYRHDVAAEVTLQNGRRVPTLALERYFGCAGDVPPPVPPLLPCGAAAVHRSNEHIGSILDEAGDRRFASRVNHHLMALNGSEAGQVLYEGIMGALGYVKNKAPMMQLARCLPLSRLAASVEAEASDEECLAGYQALLFGKAGLLPSQSRSGYPEIPANEWVNRLESVWMDSGETASLSAGDWHSFKVRPGGFPRRRLAAMSYLLCHYRRDGLLPVLMCEVENYTLDKGCGGFKEWLLVGAEGFWKKYLDFGWPARRVVPALLGPDRADIIVVNVLLPFTVARGQAGSLPGLAEKALEIYHHYPAVSENTLEKHMRRQLGISRCPVNSGRRQQGLLYIYKTLCSQGKCGECHLG